MSYLTINEAAQISDKSIQTIRRMIKQKKVKIKQQRTPQGFNYMIEQESLEKFLGVGEAKTASAQETTTNNNEKESSATREHRSLDSNEEWKENFKSELSQFTQTIGKLVDQNAQDKSNFFGLIKTFQDRVIILEDQIKLLKQPEGNWWQFWK